MRFYIPFLPVDSSKCYSWAFNISWEASRFVATLIHVMVQHHQVLKEAAVCVLTHQRGFTATDYDVLFNPLFLLFLDIVVFDAHILLSYTVISFSGSLLLCTDGMVIVGAYL